MENDAIDDKHADPRSTNELIWLALTEPDKEAAWKLLSVLHARGNREVLEAAELLCAADSIEERQLGVNILSQLGEPDRTFPEECFQCLAAMLSREADPGVLQSIAIAFGQLEDPRCIDLLIPFKTHPSAKVRLGVVHGLSGHDIPSALQTLIELSRDADADTRGWATFSLATFTEVDTPEIRQALLARAADPDDETRGEALVGLARRKEQSVIDLLLKELTACNVGAMILEAVEEIADPRLLPALRNLKSWWPGNSATKTEWLDRVIASCENRP
jgi:HEAT repeat protein